MPECPSTAKHGQILVIDRSQGRISLAAKTDHFPLAANVPFRKIPIFGVLGWIPARAQPQLVVITKRVRVGEWPDRHVVYRLEGSEIIHVTHTPITDETRRLIDAVSGVLTTPYFYFCYTEDLTATRQRLFLASKESQSSQSILGRADERFVWNRSLLGPLLSLSPDIQPFLTPMIHGAVFIFKCGINGKDLDWILVSRRSNRRVGTRFFLRGCDDHGRVSNFVETEQIVTHGSMVSSFVQTRGSMPMFWEQVPDIRYKPKALVTPKKESIQGFVAHFKEQVPLYGDQVIINLIDQKKAEGQLELALKKVCYEAQLKGVHYVAFDFHKECSKMRYDRLQILINNLREHVVNYGCFFYHNNDPASLQIQRGVFRTNCMDCLDRTNVVQSLLATENLNLILKRMGILSPSDTVLEQVEFQNIFKNAWADHADLISIQYAGTGALKTDFTRMGVRTKYGLLQDGWNSAIRYVFNNFTDGIRTDALRYFTGEVTMEEYLKQCQKKKPSVGPLVYLPGVFLAIFITLILTLVFTQEVGLTFFFLFIGAIGFMYLTGQMILQNGRIWVNFPQTLQYA